MKQSDQQMKIIKKIELQKTYSHFTTFKAPLPRPAPRLN